LTVAVTIFGTFDKLARFSIISLITQTSSRSANTSSVALIDANFFVTSRTVPSYLTRASSAITGPMTGAHAWANHVLTSFTGVTKIAKANTHAAFTFVTTV
jgi:hypothetical protein